jgi:hypothetical protein
MSDHEQRVVVVVVVVLLQGGRLSVYFDGLI